MGSALGDYVHLALRNYIKYGAEQPINKGRGQELFYYEAYRKQRLKKNDQDLAKLRKAIGVLRSRMQFDSQVKEEQDEQQSKVNFQKMVDAAYLELSKTTTSDLIKRLYTEKDNKFVLSDSLQESAIHENTLKNTRKEGNNNTSSAALSKMLDLKRKINERIAKINNGEYKTEKGLTGAINFILESYEKINRNIASLKYTYGNLSLDYKNDNNTLSLSTLGKIQNALNEITYSSCINKVRGDFGELLFYFARDSYWKTGISEVHNAIEKVSGDTMTPIVFTPSQLAVDLSQYNNKKYKKEYKEINGLIQETYSIIQTKDKVDASIVINNQNLFGSIKDYKDLSNEYVTKGGIKLQDNVNFLYALIALNNLPYLKNFGNHWLNLHAHRKKVIQKGGLLPRLEEANKILKFETAYEALASGNPLKNAKYTANVFVVIERKTGKVYAHSTTDMLEENSANLNNFIFEPETAFSKRYKNLWANSIEERIASILMDVHKTKVQVTYKVNALQRNSI